MKEVESGSKNVKSRSRIRTDIKLAEQNREGENLENASNLLKSVMTRLIKETIADFNRHKEESEELVRSVKNMVDESVIDEIEEKLEALDSPSQHPVLEELSEELKNLAIDTLKNLYDKVFDIELRIKEKEPSSEDYPVDYWAENRMEEVEDLRSVEGLDLFTQKYELLMEDADSRWKYDIDRLNSIGKKLK
ncbi:MAG: hypothetical protein SYNGOMJ08_00855 [Candidatus Syntrophoarchaeum sp. GoM_oil]|nr:MAG: hypothetical protein SYNGOMJ08_00855 [Candidatus Syntrophoarchaeum sp. GoM_oil]